MNSFARRSQKWLPVTVGVTLLVAVMPTHAAFHLWNIREVYTDASGSRQFIEFFTTFGSQQFIGGHTIRVTDGVTTNTFTIPSNLPGDSANRAFLIGTAGIAAAGSPTPDYIIPNNFLFAGGGTITFFGANSGTYTALPTDGILSRTWGGGNAVNSPRNFANQTGSITNPPAPPSISITNPANHAMFAAPATVTVGVAAADSDGTVASVRLLTNGVPAATNTIAPFVFTLASLPAGDYTLRAIAQDNSSLTGTSAPVVVHVSDLPMLVPALGTNGLIQFTFATRTGISYVIERAAPLTNFSPLTTNPGTGDTLQFQETDGSAAQRSYRVRLQQ